MRRLIAFPCEGEQLIGSIDDAGGETGLLIVSGGNEIRCGAHRGMAMLAAELASRGTSVFRFDRRGIGDSSGANGGYASSRADIIAALAAFRGAYPGMRRVIGFGNCDAATALILHGGDAVDGLILANPWVIEQSDDLPPAAAIRARYAARLKDPASWARLLSGKADFGKLFDGLAKIAATPREARGALAERVFQALSKRDDATILLARGDATAIAFADAAKRSGYAGKTATIDTASHSFARAPDKAALLAAIIDALGQSIKRLT